MITLCFLMLLMKISGVKSPPMLISGEIVECVEENGKRGFKDPNTNIDHLCFTTDERHSCNITFQFDVSKLKFCRDVCCRKEAEIKTVWQSPTSSGTTAKPRNNLPTTEFPEKGTGKASSVNKCVSEVWRIFALTFLGVIIIMIIIINRKKIIGGIKQCCRKKTGLNNEPNNTDQFNMTENGNLDEQQSLHDRETWGS